MLIKFSQITLCRSFVFEVATLIFRDIYCNCNCTEIRNIKLTIKWNTFQVFPSHLFKGLRTLLIPQVTGVLCAYRTRIQHKPESHFKFLGSLSLSSVFPLSLSFFSCTLISSSTSEWPWTAKFHSGLCLQPIWDLCRLLNKNKRSTAILTCSFCFL